jgi:hypothetical protein
MTKEPNRKLHAVDQTVRPMSAPNRWPPRHTDKLTDAMFFHVPSDTCEDLSISVPPWLFWLWVRSSARTRQSCR